MAGIQPTDCSLETLNMDLNKRDVLIIMTRLPREGRNKTRLIPELGPAGATAMHERLALHTIGRASAFIMLNPNIALRILVEGGTATEAQEWLGGGDCREQTSGDLGARLHSAVHDAFTDGARRVIVIGTDCPSIDENILTESFQILEKTDLVFGPAADGGYYLVGLSQECPQVFENIEWGGPKVLAQSLDAAHTAKCKTVLLSVLEDVDVPDDLTNAEKSLTAGESISIIIPTYNEELRLDSLLEKLKLDHPHEIIVADGGSHDRTLEIAKQAGVRVIHAAKGRASQMNLAAASATGDFLLFLHADTLPPNNYQQIIRRILQTPETSAGAFRFTLAGKLKSAPIIEKLVSLRCKIFNTPYGDQGLFLRRSIFRHVGRFPDWPVMEDLHIIRSLKKIGHVRISHEAASTSSRRWENGGTIRTFLRHQLMLAAYYLGVPVRHIAKLRPGISSP